MFYVGQKVVCVVPTWGSSTGSIHQRRCCPNLPTKGKVYTIRTIHSVVAILGQPASAFIRLCEIVNPQPYGTEPYFDAYKYRAVIERKTDIAIFTEMLGPTRTKELALTAAEHPK